jgi:hypothetical protein
LRGELGAKLSERSQSGGSGLDVQRSEAPAECRGRGVLAGVGAGEQPPGRQLFGDSAATRKRQLLDERAEWLGNLEFLATKSDGHHTVLGAVNIVGAKRGDAGERLRREDDERAGNTVAGVNAVVGDESLGDLPPALGVGWALAVTAVAGRQPQRRGEVTAALRPGEEGSDVVPDDAGSGEPGIDVDLPGVGEHAAVPAELGDELDRLADTPPCVADREVKVAADGSAQRAQDPPAHPAGDGPPVQSIQCAQQLRRLCLE